MLKIPQPLQAATGTAKVASGDRLTDYSPKDKPWDRHRGESQDVESIYAAAAEFERYARRIHKCAGLLRFAWVPDPEMGQVKIKLHEAHFCRVRTCPTCAWRRGLMYQARFLEALPDLARAHPKARWLFLTLTIRNCPIGELRDTLREMNRAWGAFVKRPEFGVVDGWIRSTEVTRTAPPLDAHPHFHVLLMVPPSYFHKSYLSQAKWTDLWRSCARLDYTPIVNVKTVKPRVDLAGVSPVETVRPAVVEVLKYSVKPSDLTDDPAWLLEYTRQVHHLRFLASGGVLKDVLREAEESDADMVHTDPDEPPEPEEEPPQLAFGWRQDDRHYRRDPDRDR